MSAGDADNSAPNLWGKIEIRVRTAGEASDDGYNRTSGVFLFVAWVVYISCWRPAGTLGWSAGMARHQPWEANMRKRQLAGSGRVPGHLGVA